jgi:hypothetical protein
MADNVVKFRKIEKKPEPKQPRPPGEPPQWPAWLPWAVVIALAVGLVALQNIGLFGR